MPEVTFSYKMYSKVFLTLLHCSLHTLIYQGVFLLNFIQLTYVTPSSGGGGGWWWVFKEVVSCKSSLNCRGPKSQRVCGIIVVHAASLPKTKCSSCPTCVSPLCTSCPLPTAVWAADCWGHSSRNTQVWIPQTFFLFVSFFHINSVKTGLFFLHKNVFIRGVKTKTESVSAPIHARKDKGGKTEAGSHFFNFCIQG